MGKGKSFGIKKKALLGCIVLGLILLFSSVISVYEFRSMNKYVTDVIADNISGIDAARDLLNATENHNLTLMSCIDSDLDSFDKTSNEVFAAKFADVRDTFVSAKEKAAADSVMYAYAAYMQVVGEADGVWLQDSFARRDWFFNRLQPVYIKFRDYIRALNVVCEDTLITNSKNLQSNYYRSIMPAFISLLLSLLLVLLFNYYLNQFFINPLLKVNRGIKAYRQFGKKYDIKVDTGDELAELNETVKDLVDLNQSYKKQLEKK